MRRPERDPAPDAERPGRRIRVDHRPVRPRLAAEDDRPVGRERVGVARRAPAGSGGGASRGGGVASVGIRWQGAGGGGDGGGGDGRVVAEEIRAAETAVPLAALGVEDPELRPSPRRPVAAAGDERLRPLADDVPSEPDPRSAARAPAGARSIRRRRSRGRASARAARGRRGASPARRARPARRRSRSATLAGVVPAVGPRRQVDDEDVDRAAGEEHPGDRQALVERLRGQDDEPVEADAAGGGLDRIERPGEIEPGDDRAVGLGLGDEPQGEGRGAGARGAAQGDAGAARAARPARRSRRGPESRSGRSARRQFAARPREKERARMGRRAARPGAAPWPALRPPAELRHPIASGGTPEQPTRPGRGWPSDGQTRTSVRYRQRLRMRQLYRTARRARTEVSLTVQPPRRRIGDDG